MNKFLLTFCCLPCPSTMCFIVAIVAMKHAYLKWTTYALSNIGINQKFRWQVMSTQFFEYEMMQSWKILKKLIHIALLTNILILKSIILWNSTSQKQTKYLTEFYPRAKFWLIFRSVFGQWSFKKKCFWDLLTFSISSVCTLVSVRLWNFKDGAS